MRSLFLFFALILSNHAFGQFRIYEEGIKKYNEKDYYAAIELFSDFLTKPLHDPKFDADTYYWRGLAAFKLNDFVSATDDLKQSLALNHPNTGNIHWFLAKSLDKLNQSNESLAEYGNALRILGSDKVKQAQILTERANLYGKMNNITSAQQDLQTAYSMDPSNKKIKEDLDNLTLLKSRGTSIPIADASKSDGKKNTSVKQEGKVTSISAKEEKKVEPPVTQPTITRKQEDKTVVTAESKNPLVEPKKEEKRDVASNNETQKVISPIVAPVELKEPTLAELFKDEKRFALVIGNSAYSKEIGVLRNPVNDATDFAAAIKKMGFDVTLITDASYGKIRAEMMKFRDRLNDGERDKTVGLFFYAGHGLQHDNENYIVPVDAEIQFEDDISRYCFPIQKMVLSQMENTNSRMNIVILDACRNNPFPALHRGIGESQGLGELKKARGAFIAYATSPGSVASDGTGRNGLYTQELIKAINKPSRTIEQVFKDVRGNVLRQSGDKQNPWENSNIVGDFYFKFDQ